VALVHRIDAEDRLTPVNLPVETAGEMLHPMETGQLPRITHGICETCAARLMASD